jgi:hypothetical protein
VRDFSFYARPVSVMADEWTDKRMDDFAGRVDRFEAQVDKRFDNVDKRFDRFESRVDKRFDNVDKRFDRFEERVETRFEALNKTIYGSTAAILAVLIAQIVFG